MQKKLRISMLPAVNFPHYDFNHYLTPLHHEILQECNSPLKRHIRYNLLSSTLKVDIKIAKLSLDILNQSSKSCREITEKILYVIITEGKNNIREILKKLTKIFAMKGEQALGTCVDMQENFSLPVILEAIEAFYQITLLTTAPLSSISHFPPYEAAIRKLGLKLKNQPNNLEKINSIAPFKKQEHQPPAPLLKTVPANLLNALEKSFSLPHLIQTAISYLDFSLEKNQVEIETYKSFFSKVKKDSKLNESSKVALIKITILASRRKDSWGEKELCLAELEEILAEAQHIYEKWGEETLQIFYEATRVHFSIRLEHIIHIFKHMHILAEDLQIAEQAFELLDCYSNCQLSPDQFLEKLEQLAPTTPMNAAILEKDIKNVLVRFKKDDGHVHFCLPDVHLKTITKQFSLIQGLCHKWKHLQLEELISLAHKIRFHPQPNYSDILKIMAIGHLALKIKFQIELHSIQTLTVLGLLAHETSCIAQVKTGEGKSLIVTLLAFVLAMQNKSVHVISSSQNLARRDQQQAAKFFNIFAISSSHICKNEPEANSFKANILYGTATDFEFAVMREMLYFKPLFPQHSEHNLFKRFNYAIIDELDNLTIDTAANSARLGNAAEIHFNWVYKPIFAFVKANYTKSLFKDESLQQLKEFLKEYSNGKFSSQVHQLGNRQLKNWLKSAFKALFVLQENIDYVVDAKSGEDKKKILIVDAINTGRIHKHSRWSHGLHEFVEIKHSISPAKETITPISLSHPAFYEMYNCLYGLTGTLGSQIERETLRKIYQVETFDVPTQKPVLRKDFPLVAVDTNELHLQTIIEKIQQFKQTNRPLLVLCPTIHASKVLGEMLIKNNISHRMLNEIQTEKEEDILAVAGLPGALTIATNNAGRGTDIRLDPESLERGGLHVILTFYPNSDRVEYQARGRAGRQGQKGSSEIIISLENLPHLLKCMQKIEVPRHEFIEHCLHYQRMREANFLKHEQIFQAEIERYCYTLVQEFFTFLHSFNALCNNEQILEKWADTLKNQKISKNHSPDIHTLSPTEQLIVKDILKLLQVDQAEQEQWKNLLKQIGAYIQAQILHTWSVKVYKKFSEMSGQLKIQEMIRAQEEVDWFIKIEKEDKNEEASNTLNKQISCIRNDKLALLKEEIKKLFEHHMALWKKYQDSSGLFFIEYIREMAKVSLKNIAP
ncbi:Uncharacterized protein NEOC65_000539 [Neochlamydia sp. AcF65]|nr:Uncharacterized protein [Neochlamydia sp. AcF65]